MKLRLDLRLFFGVPVCVMKLRVDFPTLVWGACLRNETVVLYFKRDFPIIGPLVRQKTHQEGCSYPRFQCKYEEYGCEVAYSRRLMDLHMKGFGFEHSEMLEKAMLGFVFLIWI